MNVSADGGQFLFTGLLRYTRNETERYAKVAARTLVRRRHMQKTIQFIYVARSALKLLVYTFPLPPDGDCRAQE